MKRLLSILLMNAWGGLRQKASLPTMSLVGISVMALLVASTVTADASPHTNIPVVTTVANAVHAGITGPISSILNDSTPPKPEPPKRPKVQLGATSSSQSSTSTATNSNNTATSSNATSGSTNASRQGQSNSPAATVSIATSALSCTPNTGTNSYSINVASAQLNFQTPPTAGGTITYVWDIVSSNGSVTPEATSDQQQFVTGQTSITLTPPSQTQYLYTVSSNSSSFSFRLHITGPFDISSSPISVPMSADGSCPPSNNN